MQCSWDALDALKCDTLIITSSRNFQRQIDQSPGVYDIIWSIKNVTGGKSPSVPRFQELVVRRASDDFGSQLRDRIIIQNGPKSARCEDVTLHRSDVRIADREHANIRLQLL